MRHASAIVIIIALLSFTPAVESKDATCPDSVWGVTEKIVASMPGAATNFEGAGQYEQFQYHGYLIGKALAVVDPDSQTAACLSMVRAHVTANAPRDKATAFTAGLAGLAPPSIDIGINDDEIGRRVVIKLGGIPIEPNDDGSDTALLLGTWEMVELTFELGDQTETRTVQPGGYVVHFGDDGKVTVGMTIFQKDGTTKTTEGTWSFDSALSVVTMIIDGEEAPMSLVSITRDRLVFRVPDDDAQIMQTMVFARGGG